MSSETNYNSWTKTGLIQRLKELESELKTRRAPLAQPAEPQNETSGAVPEGVDAAAPTKVKPSKGKRKVDPSRYSTRYIAIKLAYLGKNYGGFEFQAIGNQPSIEEELWNALTKSCLIFPNDEKVVQFDCCEYSKCGRTDRGVSAFGQVIGLRVRSNRPLPTKRAKLDESAPVEQGAAVTEPRPDEMEEDTEETKPFDDIRDELCYPRIINRLLPKDIRALAWCPSPPPDFSARFSCRERQYRYFFTEPAFAPEPSFMEPPSRSGGSKVKTGWLDIAAMRDAAKRFEGEHDFRNVCKIDPAKQITNFHRRIFESDIVEVKDVSTALPYLQNASFAVPGIDDGPHPKVYYFHVRGSAFLWHQIRHMVALLFLVGQGLEAPSLVSELLDVSKNPSRPSYVMADEVPLVLWDCIFPDLRDEVSSAPVDVAKRKDAMQWIYVGAEHAPNRFGQFGLMDGMWELWRERKMDELLANQLLQQISQQGSLQDGSGQGGGTVNGGARVYEGGNSRRLGGKYVPVMEKELLQSPEEQNDKYAKRKGYADAEDMRTQKGIGRRKDDEAMADE
ncbi:tRNA pseudouridine(38/39) synthase [Tolypocladium ophioglossoides CBS 100239]|uniref:tRNA pseudouridine(38/39) synthase n=1 Tax=Tolypocladium ophioglossoides (strain CBS 100239) TaxID=1163406 RepID=A0A0L0NKW3_TOLOC|nr:tRNA pseudouridine(38/39) synthase [Tolypocladium ophioglossoides CBS 100239]